MNKVFVDSDVVIDLLIDRKPSAHTSAILFDLADKGKIQIWMSSLSLNNIYYVTRKVVGEKRARIIIKELIELIEIQEVGKKEIVEAFNSEFKDMEDAIQYRAACEIKGVAALITRNTKDYGKVHLPVFTPEAYLETLDLI